MPTVSGTQLWQWRNQAKQEARLAGISPTEVDWLLREITNLDGLALRLESFKECPHIQISFSWDELCQLWEKRITDSCPLQYLVGSVSWRHFKLRVSPEVLIPRPETEQIIDIAVEAVQSNYPLAEGNWVDLGTGSGAIAIGLAEVFPQGNIHAVDSSSRALTIAQENAKQLNFGHRIKFYQGSWWQPLETLQGKVKGMVSNPPYIPTPLVSQLQPEVANHEPHLALDGGGDGLTAIRHLVDSAPNYLESGGIWLIEMMAGQSQEVVNLLQDSSNYRNIRIFSDLGGIERFVLAYRC